MVVLCFDGDEKVTILISLFSSKPGEEKPTTSDKRPISPVVRDKATAFADNDERIRNDIQSSYSVS